MKVSIRKPNVPVFTPFTLEITFETGVEVVRAFTDLGNTLAGGPLQLVYDTLRAELKKQGYDK